MLLTSLAGISEQVTNIKIRTSFAIGKARFFLKFNYLYRKVSSEPMQFLSKLPNFLRNFYVVTFLIFLVWMLFLDSNDLVSQYKLSSKLDNLETEKAYYLEKIGEVKKDREELLSNKELLEKFAREKYLMRRKTEDLFVIIETEE
jgi:cell division protein DivIC